MNRRDFLKISSLLPVALFVQFSPLLSQSKNLPVELAANGMILRSTFNGEIHTSRDAGRTWQLHTRLGSENAIVGLFSDGSQRIHAQVAFRGHSFDLVLAKDNKYWMTI